MIQISPAEWTAAPHILKISADIKNKTAEMRKIKDMSSSTEAPSSACFFEWSL